MFISGDTMTESIDMLEMKPARNPETDVKVKGFFRVNIEEDGEIVGDSGWRENIVVNDGFLNYLVQTLGALAGSSQVSYVNVGEGTIPGAAANALESEVTGTSLIRHSVTPAASGSTTLRLTATLASTNSFVSQQESIANIGLFAHSTTPSLFAGNTYTSSTLDTNQNVNVTYDINFS